MSDTVFKSQSDGWISKYPDTLKSIDEMNHINSLFKEYQKKYPFTENFFIAKDEHDKELYIISVTIDIDSMT
ncbi:hypothetical protein ACFSKN_11365 [Mariniflexile gromovii]|uniref:Uncharacterized protein n=1 Tax=Mariniflexile gromovii TaxID=362523 RepID=A0ABS4BYT9_9FLAO|nr:hypothetical protein [Mariniflexile gromovii]MBP0905230.1 hypothetical protein [Mariniflexile gromovii]